jgi:fatty-acyl-CoA synthase
VPPPTRHFAHWPPFLPRTLTVPESTLAYNLEVSARRYPGRSALVFYGASIDYATLAREVDALAGWLQHEAGVDAGDRVLLGAQNSPLFVIGYYAILRADAVVVPCNPMLQTAELEHLAADSGATLALCARDLLGAFAPLLGNRLRRVLAGRYADWLAPADLADLRIPDFLRERDDTPLPAGCTDWRDARAAARAGAHAPHAPQAGPDDLALLPYTSGTTGRPKGCRHTHRTMLATTTAHIAWSNFTSDSVFLATMPLFHATGMQGMMNAPIQAGATAVLLPRWDREIALEMIGRHRVTVWSAITTMVTDVLAHPGLDAFDLSSLLRVGGGGAPMPEAVAATLRTRFGLDYVEGYGLTETAAPITYNPQHRPKRQCAGMPLFGVDIRALDPETGLEVAEGEPGELAVHGPQVFLGYWGQPQADAQAFVEIDGKRFFRTGDIGRVDDEGYWFITDRLKRMINAAGLKVWPAEVEALLYAHPGVRECCVIAARDPRRGETVKAVVVVRDGHRHTLDEAALIAWARGRMAAYKVPRIVEFADTLPRTANGKVLWRVLQAREG